MKFFTGIIAISFFLSGCAIDPYTGEEKVANTAWGAGAGAAAGAAIGAAAGGGKGALIGAAAGSALGAGTGYYFDRQEAQLRAQLEGTGVRLQRNGNQLNLIMPGNITFMTNSSEVNPNFFPILDSVSKVLREFNKTTINVSGFTDSVGSFEHNQKLSEDRANSVASYLVRSGVSHGRIQARGFSERYPIASNDDEIGRSQNRRVEITIRPNG